MRYLEKHNHVTPGELAREVSLSQATVTGILDRLEKKGMIERQRSLLDKRKVILELTLQGKEQLESSPQPLHYRFSSRLAMLPVESQKNICAVLEQIVEMMEAAEFDAAPILTSGPASATSSDTEQFLTPEYIVKDNNYDEDT
jgi:DNA-binding MarR family transcriptional regulator